MSRFTTPAELNTCTLAHYKYLTFGVLVGTLFCDFGCASCHFSSARPALIIYIQNKCVKVGDGRFDWWRDFEPDWDNKTHATLLINREAREIVKRHGEVKFEAIPSFFQPFISFQLFITSFHSFFF